MWKPFSSPLSLAGSAGGGNFTLKSDKSQQRTVSLNFGRPPLNFGPPKSRNCTDKDTFPSITDTEGDCRTVATLLTLNEWVAQLGAQGYLVETQRDLNLLAMPVAPDPGSTAFVSFNIRFPSQFKGKGNLLRFGFSGQGDPVTVERRAADTWTIEAVFPTDFTTDPPAGPEPSVAVLLEGNEKSGKKGLFTPTGEGPLPFHIRIVCDFASQCPKP